MTISARQQSPARVHVGGTRVEQHQHGIAQMFQPLLDPAGVMGLFDIEITGRGERAGHSVICAVWRPSP